MNRKLAKRVKRSLRRVYTHAMEGPVAAVVGLPVALTSRRRLASLRQETGLRVHLGCGDDRQPDFVNVDSRPTRATDLAMDLNRPAFARNSISFAFSNAFFEHLYRDSRLPHLRRIRKSLAPDGACCYIGVPYFPNIARFYLEGGAGTAGPVFDLYNVYRYTHGDPEQAPAWWLGQLHKSLFDEDELGEMLSEAGFGSFVMFCYAYPGDYAELSVTMGFYASRSPQPTEELRAACLAFLERFADIRIRMASIEWLQPGRAAHRAL